MKNHVKDRILIYCPGSNTPKCMALDKVVNNIFSPEMITVSSELETELRKDEYVLVIDASGRKGSVEHSLKHMNLEENPEVKYLGDNMVNAVRDIARYIANFYNQKK